MLRIAFLVGIASIGGSGVWFLVAAPRIELAELQRDISDARLTEASSTIAGLKSQVEAVAKLDRQFALLNQTISQTQREQRKAFEELKANDANVRDYLAGAVPVELGRLYARPETTDPELYNGATSMQPGTVSATGTKADGN